MSEGATDGTTELTVESAASMLEGLLADPTDTGTPTDVPPESETAEVEEEVPADEPDAEESAPEEPTEEHDEPTDPSDDETPEPEPQPKTYRVPVDGQEVEVTEEELLKGYSRTADYTRKTMALAEQRKATEQELEAARAERAQYAEALTQLRTVLERGAGPEPDWEKLKAEAPEQFPLVFAEYQLQQERLGKVKAEEARIQAQQAADAARAREAMLAAEQQQLVQALPEWGDPAVRSKETADLVSYARDMGFGPDDLAGVTDHRVVLMLRKAMLYDRVQAQAKAATKPPAPAPKAAAPVLKPGAKPPAPKGPPKQQQDAIRRLRATGDVKDAAAAIETMLDL